jgi:hypothetical protein
MAAVDGPRGEPTERAPPADAAATAVDANAAPPADFPDDDDDDDDTDDDDDDPAADDDAAPGRVAAALPYLARRSWS